MTEYESSFATQTMQQNSNPDDVVIEVQPLSEIQISESPTEENKLFNSHRQIKKEKSNTTIHIDKARLTKSQDVSERKPWLNQSKGQSYDLRPVYTPKF